MLLLIGCFLGSLVPCAVIFLWLRKQNDMWEGHPKLCDKAFLNGALSALPAVACSAAFALIGAILGIKNQNIMLYDAYTAFITLAFSEELSKFFMMRRIVKKEQFSWLQVAIIMALVGMGFEIIEAIPYAVGAGPGHMFMRGFSMMHVAFGFVMGYFYGKSLKTGNKAYAVLGFVIAWMMHGVYDCCLQDNILNMTWPGYIALGLAVLCALLIVVFIIFVIRGKKNDTYTLPMEGCGEHLPA